MKTKSTLNSFSKSGKVKTLTSKQKLNILGERILLRTKLKILQLVTIPKSFGLKYKQIMVIFGFLHHNQIYY